MRVRLLGTGTSIPSLTRASSAYLLSVKRKRILVDVGPSVVRRLLEVGHPVTDIDVIVLTHFHVDHTADLSTFLFACNYGIKPRTKPLTIIGGQGMMKFFRRLSVLYRWITPKSYDLTVRSLPSGILEMEGIWLQTARANHNKESIAVRVKNGANVVFSGDTDFSRNLIGLAREADLLVTECSFPVRKVKGHLNLAVLDKIVAAARPKRVILSHLYPDWDNFDGVLHDPYLLGEDGLEIEL
jgi:ribonuclease BN (tRNA processing enzyme)